MSGEDEFLAFDHFAGPVSTTLADGDPFLALPAGAAFWASPAPGSDLGGDVLVEVSLRPAVVGRGAVALVLRASNGTSGAAPLCNTSVLPDTNPCSGAPGETNFIVPASEPDAVGACAAACCEQNATCGAWIVLPGMDFDAQKCECAAAPCTCCWLKPRDCAGSAPYANATAGFLWRPPAPPGPPLPLLGGYTVTVNFSSALLSLTRSAGGGAEPAPLGEFDLSSLENGLVDGWSMLRVLARTAPGAGLAFDVWWNPAVKETGFVGNSSDAGRTFTAPPPRISAVDAAPLAGAGLAVAAGGEDARIDFIAALPASVY